MPLKVAVIGGGAAGLVTLKHLIEAHKFFPGADIEAHIFEAHDDIGGVFHHQVYEDAELVSSKYLTAFSDFRVPKDEADFLSAEKYREYLKAYADEFSLWEHIQCSTTVTSIKPHPTEPGHILHLQARGNRQESLIQGSSHYHVVAICTGLNREPFMPDIPGLTAASLHTATASNAKDGTPNSKPGPVVIHSSTFKSRAQFGQDSATVLILGAGETAMDIAHLAVTTATCTHRVVMSHRDGFMHAPKVVPQPFRAGGRSGGPEVAPGGGHRLPAKPLDCAIASLFDTAYVPPVIQCGPLLSIAYDFFVKNMAWLVSGTRAGFDQWVGGVGYERFHVDAVLFCKSDRAIPYLSEQWRSKSLLNRCRTWLINIELRPTRGRKIDLAPWPSHLDDEGIVHFEKNDRPESRKMETEKPVRPDVVIFATGYKQSFPFMPHDDERYPSLDACSIRGIYRDIDDGVAYIGFVRPAFGAIPPLAELQAQRWIHALLQSPKYRAYFAPAFIPPCRRSPAAIAPYELKYKLRARPCPQASAKGMWMTNSARRVDHESYAYQLAVDMGAAPTAMRVWSAHGAAVFVTWAMGPNFNPKFRLVGPWSGKGAAGGTAALMSKDGELGRVVHQTGGIVFFVTYTVIPLLIFAPLCLVVNMLTWVWGSFGIGMTALPRGADRDRKSS